MKQTTVNLALLFVSLDLPEPERECRFHPKRRWRFDWAWPDFKVALEREGGFIVHGRLAGRHVSRKGYEADAEKYSEAAIAGWCVIRATPRMLDNGSAFELVRRALIARGWRK